jgi:hypothetical protein
MGKQPNWRYMNVGTKSLLFGVHQFLWHPITVFAAWYELYGMPNWKECVCIFIHDWGYWGRPNMDGLEGEKHPEFAAMIALAYLDRSTWNSATYTYRNLCLFHSRHYARYHGVEPSMLCWADKLSIKYDPWWFYLPRAWLSGELAEYRALHGSMGENFKTHHEWYIWASERAIHMGLKQNSDGISFHPQRTKDYVIEKN